jgi:hypothetical protein
MEQHPRRVVTGRLLRQVDMALHLQRAGMEHPRQVDMALHLQQAGMEHPRQVGTANSVHSN